MQQKIINMLEAGCDGGHHADSSLSFKPFLNFLRNRRQNENPTKKRLFSYIINKFQSFDKGGEPISLDELQDYNEVLDLLFAALTDVTQDEQKLYWGLCMPMTSTMFYGTEVFYSILENANSYDKECSLCDADYLRFIFSEMEHYYGFILKTFYDFDLQKKRPLVRTIKESESKLTRHFSLTLNTSFVEVTANKALPDIDVALLRQYEQDEDGLLKLSKLLPISMFSFTGFTVTTVKDISQQFAMESIRSTILQNQEHAGVNGYQDVLQALKELTGTTKIEFSILPFFKINGKLVDDNDCFSRTALFASAKKNSSNHQACCQMLEEFVLQPHRIYFNNLNIEVPAKETTRRLLHNEGIKSYALLPAYYSNKLVGAVEIYSRNAGVVTEELLSLLEPAKELLAQLMNNRLTALELDIDAVIKEKYTRLQPAVQWKFVEVAWQQLQQKKIPAAVSGKESDEIGFKNVYPLYGAVDIRNSTIDRNAAMLKDNTLQLALLVNVLNALKDKTSFGLLDEKIFLANKWLMLLSETGRSFEDQLKLTDFLDKEATPFLENFTQSSEDLRHTAKNYFNAIDENEGQAFACRRSLETSMTSVIGTVNNYLDQLKTDIQKAYPCYFEKFRTDGVEYDIYIGQSISPDNPFKDLYLKNLRFLQLKSMAAISKLTNALLPTLPNPVKTTQLIFIHSQPIDILFRNDEKRFDVEGAYNIRYHIIKKRIDKVHLRDSDERLTQPGKIALVYFSDAEASEYISYIKYLQADGILKDDLEKLQLEELSGVTGLKALRVGVNLENSEA